MYQIKQDYNFETKSAILVWFRYVNIKPYSYKILKQLFIEKLTSLQLFNWFTTLLKQFKIGKDLLC